jgi:hypothetical protein
MPRLRDTRTGVVVSVDDATASDLGAAYEAADEPKKAPAKKSASSKKSE